MSKDCEMTGPTILAKTLTLETLPFPHFVLVRAYFPSFF